MTTIATDGKSIAADGLEHVNGTVIHRASRKLHRLSDGSILGACGNMADGVAVAKWLSGFWPQPAPLNRQPEVENDFGGIILTREGQVFWISSTLIPTPAEAPIAIGSGMDIAIGAMLAGVEPLEAVQIASERDVHTGGAIIAEACHA